MALALQYCPGGKPMIKVDYTNEIFASELRSSLNGRGVDCFLSNDSNAPSTDGCEDIYVASMPSDFQFNNSGKFVSFLKENKFKKSVLVIFSASEFKVDYFLNGAVSLFYLPVDLNSVSPEKDFYFHYMIEQILKNYPNLPAKDENSIKLTALIKRIAVTDATVLINGSTGTGKEVVSNLIHHFSNRSEKAFVAVNCAAIPDQMLESMLFGHEKGSFTGAVQPNKGLLRAADEGTVLLDEISEMPIALQAKLLRVIQEKKVMPIGSSAEVSVDVRIIATTNRNMAEEVKAGRFREDLFYRLNVFPLNTLRLSDRKFDIPAIVANMLFSLDSNCEDKVKISGQAFEKLMEYHWPGNVRELYNVIQRAKILCTNNSICIPDLIFDDCEKGKPTNTAEALAAKFRTTNSSEMVL
jgi:two-component system response regulator FlrC